MNRDLTAAYYAAAEAIHDLLCLSRESAWHTAEEADACIGSFLRSARAAVDAARPMLESRPVCAPPARRGPLPPVATWGHTAIHDPETEPDALPGITGRERDDFMSGGAR